MPLRQETNLDVLTEQVGGDRDTISTNLRLLSLQVDLAESGGDRRLQVPMMPGNVAESERACASKTLPATLDGVANKGGVLPEDPYEVLEVFRCGASRRQSGSRHTSTDTSAECGARNHQGVCSGDHARKPAAAGPWRSRRQWFDRAGPCDGAERV